MEEKGAWKHLCFPRRHMGSAYSLLLYRPCGWSDVPRIVGPFRRHCSDPHGNRSYRFSRCPYMVGSVGQPGCEAKENAASRWRSPTTELLSPPWARTPRISPAGCSNATSGAESAAAYLLDSCKGKWRKIAFTGRNLDIVPRNLVIKGVSLNRYASHLFDHGDHVGVG